MSIIDYIVCVFMELNINKFTFLHIIELANLVGITWNLEKEIKSRVLYFSSCLAYAFHILYKSNYRRVICEQSKLISFLAGREENKKPLNIIYLILCFLSIFVMIFYKDGRSILKYQLGYNKTLKLMAKENNKKYDAELVLFITHPEYQGKGYGKTLLNDFHTYMKSRNKGSIYLFTDNYCDYAMYDRAGCTKLNEKVREFYFLAGEKFIQELYLYDYKIN